ncbi:TetR/AcrR family transcriptional regulator [Pimelobacter simplex]|uniref:TetR/AcrR family transcriptional regulator n=1 Tax=Nocardioides simplex TaxID=2045 RepID=A0A0A1DP93_NOCSI|nr:TetR/AcrR family transcriptional regulator [Pimelobacter simplex]AIY19236.1 Transcriptional regulator, TetR family KstR2 [Pimelobacter simplex]KAB2812645.1 TetR/AcrR family transcriptional regulator [Pimelobacter simplex]MCG8149309.1 TetR family transcriptional regulator [Pimelobacter simplex]SFM20686.1 transcriptional regulator, TetR family [Pimelobacter simplex]GEB16560.1 putative transcriptional regulator TetR family protein [Pimelobacter simplex]
MVSSNNEATARGGRRRANGTSSARRAQLLAIAAEMFATRGYSQTTVRDIADEAGILSGSLYHHFDSKEAMLTEILQEFMGNLLQQIREIADAEDSPRAALDGLIMNSFETIHRVPFAVALYQNESALLTTTPEFAFVTKASLDVEKVWLGVLKAGAKAGDFRADLDPGTTYRFIRDAIWSTVRWYNPRGRLQHKALAEQYLEMLHGGLLAG